jgi:hypothetical protein
MHVLEVQGIADNEVASGIVGKDPIASHQLTREEIQRCEANPKATLKLVISTEAYIKEKKKQRNSRYTPVARRQDKPAAVAWILKNCPDVTDMQITRLIGTTKTTIAAIRNKTHWNYSNITGKDPVLLGLCSQNDLDTLMGTVKQNKEREEKKAADEAARLERDEIANKEAKSVAKKAKKKAS